MGGNSTTCPTRLEESGGRGDASQVRVHARVAARRRASARPDAAAQRAAENLRAKYEAIKQDPHSDEHAERRAPSRDARAPLAQRHLPAAARSSSPQLSSYRARFGREVAASSDAPTHTPPCNLDQCAARCRARRASPNEVGGPGRGRPRSVRARQDVGPAVGRAVHPARAVRCAARAPAPTPRRHRESCAPTLRWATLVPTPPTEIARLLDKRAGTRCASAAPTSAASGGPPSGAAARCSAGGCPLIARPSEQTGQAPSSPPRAASAARRWRPVARGAGPLVAGASSDAERNRRAGRGSLRRLARRSVSAHPSGSAGMTRAEECGGPKINVHAGGEAARRRRRADREGAKRNRVVPRALPAQASRRAPRRAAARAHDARSHTHVAHTPHRTPHTHAAAVARHTRRQATAPARRPRAHVETSLGRRVSVHTREARRRSQQAPRQRRVLRTPRGRRCTPTERVARACLVETSERWLGGAGDVGQARGAASTRASPSMRALARRRPRRHRATSDAAAPACSQRRRETPRPAPRDRRNAWSGPRARAAARDGATRLQPAPERRCRSGFARRRGPRAAAARPRARCWRARARGRRGCALCRRRFRSARSAAARKRARAENRRRGRRR